MPRHEMDDGDRYIIDAVVDFLRNYWPAVERLNGQLNESYQAWPSSVRPSPGSGLTNPGSSVDRTIANVTAIDDALERIMFRRQALLDIARSGNQLCQWAVPKATDDHPRCFEGARDRAGFLDWGDETCTTFSEHADGGPCGAHARAERRWRAAKGLPDRRRRDVA